MELEKDCKKNTERRQKKRRGKERTKRIEILGQEDAETEARGENKGKASRVDLG